MGLHPALVSYEFHTRYRGIAYAIFPFVPAIQCACYFQFPFAQPSHASPFGAAQGQAESESLRVVCLQVDEHHVFVSRYEVFTHVACTVFREGGICHAFVQVEPAQVVFRLACRIGENIVDVHVGKHLETSVRASFFGLLGHEAGVHQFLRFFVLTFEEELADAGKAFGGLRVAVVCLRAAPHADFVQHDVFFRNASIGHHAQASVAQRKGFFPLCRRFVIP